MKNKELARKIRDHILAEPLRLNMRSWIVKSTNIPSLYRFDDGREDKFASCGTAACIGGWAEILGIMGGWTGEGEEIFDLLGLSQSEGEDLCFGSWYRHPDYQNAPVEVRARMAADKINKLFELED